MNMTDVRREKKYLFAIKYVKMFAIFCNSDRSFCNNKTIPHAIIILIHIVRHQKREREKEIPQPFAKSLTIAVVAAASDAGDRVGNFLTARNLAARKRSD